MKSSHRSKNLREPQEGQILNTPFCLFSLRQWCNQSKCPCFYRWGKAECFVYIHISCMEAELWRLPRASFLHLLLGSICHLSYILAVQPWSYYLNLISSFFKKSNNTRLFPENVFRGPSTKLDMIPYSTIPMT